MKTFEAAFRSALRQQGFMASKSLESRSRPVQLFEAPDGQRYNLREAVVTAVRGHGKEGKGA